MKTKSAFPKKPTSLPVEYEKGTDNQLLTPCPYGIMRFYDPSTKAYVASATCQVRCKYFGGYHKYLHHTINCKHPKAVDVAVHKWELMKKRRIKNQESKEV